MAYSLIEINYGLTGSFRAGSTGPSPMYWSGNTAPGTAYVSSGSLQGWWSLNTDVSSTGDVSDRSGNSRDGTFDLSPTNRPAFSSITPSSQFIQKNSNTFDGGNDAINIGTAATWNAIIGNADDSSRQMSFSAWVYKTGDGGSNLGQILTFGSTAANSASYIYTDTQDRIYFVTYWNSLPVTWSGGATGTTTLNNWHHIAITYDASSSTLGEKPKIYLDGTELEVGASINPSTGTYNGISTEDCYIGNRHDYTRGFEGSIADVAIWNKILTQDDIQAIYAVKTTGPYKILRDFDSRGSTAQPGFTGSVATFIQGYNVDSYSRFGAAIAPLIGRGDVNNVFLSSSSGMMQTSASSNYFDDGRKMANDIPAWPTLSASIDDNPNSATYGKVIYTRLPPTPKKITIGDDDYRIIETPGFVMEKRAFGYEREWKENSEPFAELTKFDPVRYLDDQLTFQWPVVLSNPNAVDPFDFSGVIEPFEIRKRITQTGTFVGDYDDPYPNSVKAGVSSGELMEAGFRKNFEASNFYDLKSSQKFAAFGSAQSPDITDLVTFIPVWQRITSGALARLNVLSSSNETAYLNAQKNLSSSLRSFRGPTYPMVTDSTGSIDFYQDSFAYQRFLKNTQDESIYDWRSYSALKKSYLLTSGGWSGNDPSRSLEFDNLNTYAYGGSGNLQGWWRFNLDVTTGSVTDYSGNNRHGTFSVGGTNRRPSFNEDTSPSLYIQTGSTIFDNENVAVNIGTAATWDAIIGNDTVNGSNQKFTIACWLYFDRDIWDSYGLGTTYSRIIDFGNSDVFIMYTETKQRLEFGCRWTDTKTPGANQAAYWRTEDGEILENSWNHIVVTYDATSPDNNARLYLNGTTGREIDGVFLPWFSNKLNTAAGDYFGIDVSDCYIGNRASFNRPWAGRLADFAIWNRDLTENEALSLFYAASSGPYALSASYILNEPKTSAMGRPDFTYKSVNVGFTYATNETGIDSLAFMGFKK